MEDSRGRTWRVLVPTTRPERMRGLRGRPAPAPGEAMLFPRTRSVHTFGMEHPIAVAGLDRRGRVVFVKVVGPNRLVLPRPRIRHVLECRAETAPAPGDLLVGAA